MNRTTDHKQALARWLSLVVALIIVLLPFSALLTTWAGSNFGHRYVFVVWKELLILAVLPLAIYLGWHDKKLRYLMLKDWLHRLILVYLLLQFVTVVVALSSHNVNLRAAAYGLIINLRFFGFFAVTMIAASFSNLLKKHWFRLTVYPSFVVVAFGLLQKLVLPRDFLTHFGYGKGTIAAYQTVDQKVDYTRLQSSLRGANPLGSYLSFVLPAYYFFKSRIKQFLMIAGVVVLYFSYSRSAWLSFITSLCLLIYLGLNSRRAKHYLAVVGLITVLISGVGLAVFHNSQVFQNDFFHTDQTSKSLKSSNASRLDSMKKGLNDVVHQPLGRGPGTAGPASQLNKEPARIAENYYLQIGQEVGLVGLALFVAINILVAFRLWQNRQDHLALFLFVTLVGINLINLVSHAWTDETLSLIWWGLAGVALAPNVILNKVRK